MPRLPRNREHYVLPGAEPDQDDECELVHLDEDKAEMKDAQDAPDSRPGPPGGQSPGSFFPSDGSAGTSELPATRSVPPAEVPIAPACRLEGSSKSVDNVLEESDSAAAPEGESADSESFIERFGGPVDSSFLPMIHPEGRFKNYWTALLAIALLYISIMVPLEICFEFKFCEEGTCNFWWWMNIYVDVFFAIDICCNLRTGYTTPNGALVMDPRLSAKEYIFSIWFVIDVVTTIPYDRLIGLTDGGDSDGTSSVRLMRIARVLKGAKVLRLSKLLRGSVLELYEDLMSSSRTARNSIKALRLLVIFTIVLHYMACIWYFVGSGQSDKREAGKNSWATSYMLGDKYEYSDESGTTGEAAALDEGFTTSGEEYGFEVEESLEDLELSSRYVTSMYWAITTMSSVGYGDITPKTDTERLAAFCMMVIGGSAYGFLIGSIAAVVGYVDAHTRVQNERMEAILTYMRQRHFPKSLQRRIKRFYRKFYAERSAMGEANVLSELPTGLKNEVALFLVHELVAKCIVFADVNVVNLSTITSMIKPVMIDGGDAIVSVGEEILDLFVVSRGGAVALEVNLTRSAPRILRELRKGDVFGAEAILHAHACDKRDKNLRPERWNMNIVANPATHDCRGCELFQLHTPDLSSLLPLHVLETLQKNVRINTKLLILSRLVKAQPERVARNNEMLKRSVREIGRQRLVLKRLQRLKDPSVEGRVEQASIELTNQSARMNKLESLVAGLAQQQASALDALARTEAQLKHILSAIEGGPARRSMEGSPIKIEHLPGQNTHAA